mgnify:FL=1
MKALCTEALEILGNLWASFQSEEISEDVYNELRNATLLDVAERAEI